jgi:asparagine synthase (glutamine-hydrolysing)
MWYFARAAEGSGSIDPSRGPVSLGLFAGHPADSWSDGASLFADLPSPRARARRGWQPARSPSGWPVLLSGWIDNIAGLASELGLGRPVDASDAASVYGAAVERWGDDADRRVIGTYAALVAMPDGGVRLARSPLATRSLFFWTDGEAILASSIIRPLFAAGVAKRLRREVMANTLSFALPAQNTSLFEGIETFPPGCVLHLGRGRRRLHRFHDIGAIRPVRFRRDEDYVEAAQALLAEAVEAALRTPVRPGATLSGGLDSAIVAAEIVRQRPGRTLPTFTFRPLPEWDGQVAAHKFGDDGPAVERFAAMHPDVQPHFVDNAGIGFDHRTRERRLASDGFYASEVSASVYDGLYQAARDHGCDWLLFSGTGNVAFSNDAIWAPAEFFRTLRWGQLWKLIGAHPADPRPMWRRFVARGIMPNLPDRLRASLRTVVHGSGPDDLANPFLRPEVAEQFRYDRDAHNMFSAGNPVCSRDFAQSVIAQSGIGAEMWEADEQVFGLQTRDVTAYRPLVEFCLGLPTGQFVRDGETRWLARRMAMGRMPEAQRTNRLYGEHNVDWHARMTPRLSELRQRVRALRDHPDLSAVLDVAAMERALDDWPSGTIHDRARNNALRFTLPAMLSFADYLDYVSGRNRGREA